MEAVAYFGEMAALVDEPRSATVVARERSRLLALDGGSLKELIHQMPEIAFEIFRVLNARVRSAERDLLERATDRQD
jgi:type IV pilus assembly protein PilB